MFRSVEYISAEQDAILATRNDGSGVIVEPGHDLWADLSPAATAYVAPSAQDALANARAAMRCSPAQMRLALLAAGVLDQVQAIADGNPQASIVWEYATVITRNNPLIASLGGDNGFTPEQIDALFIAAMQVRT